MDKTTIKTVGLVSLQDYLEKILMLKNEIHEVRSVDLARKLNFSKASVSVAIKKMQQEGYVDVSSKGFISLTLKGEEIAKAVLERHTILTKFFESLGVEENIAKEDACNIEHIISEETFQAIKKTVK